MGLGNGTGLTTQDRGERDIQVLELVDSRWYDCPRF
jgi:hypothetical protein